MLDKKRKSALTKRDDISSVVNRYVQSETTGPTHRENNRDQYYQTIQMYIENDSPLLIPLPHF